MPPLVVIGAGGHAKVVIATARDAGHRDLRVVDDDPSRWGQSILGVPIAGPSAPVLRDPDAVAVLAIGSNPTRKALADAARCAFAVVVHPSAVIHPSVILGAGTVVFAGTVIQPDTRIGGHGIVNTGASIDHDCAIGDCVHVAPGVRLAGGVTLGDGVLVGIGSAIIPGIAVGAWATIGAGAAVVRDVAARTTVVGVPAAPIPRR